MVLQYGIISKFYDLLDIIYFRKKETSPRQALLRKIPKDKEVNIVELCTGTASNSILIASHRPEAKVYGIDRSKGMLRIAMDKIIKANLFNLEIRCRDATRTGLKAEQFDHVVLSLVLHESSPELAASLLAEAKRLLKKDGRLLILEWEVPKSFWQRVLFFPIRKLEPKGFEEFVHTDFNAYFRKHGLQLMHTTHCDYSRVFEVAKLGDR